MGANLIVTGMVLNAMPIGEYDKRITLLTKERGKITAFARGARRQNSQFLAVTNPFSFGEFELFEGRSTYTVSKASAGNYFRELANDFAAACYGFYFLEFAEYYCQENGDEREMLKLLYQSLRALESTAFDNRLVRVVFELKALAINGEAPNVFRCAKCGGKEKLSHFSAETAQMLCASCAGAGAASYRALLESTVYAMQFVISSPVEKLYTFSVSPEVLAELMRAMREFFARHIRHAFRSLAVLEGAEGSPVSGGNG